MTDGIELMSKQRVKWDEVALFPGHTSTDMFVKGTEAMRRNKRSIV